MNNLDSIISAVHNDARNSGVSTNASAAWAISSIAAHFGLPYKVWTLGELEATAREEFRGLATTNPEQFAALIEEASSGEYWWKLGDATDHDWHLVSAALNDAAEVIGLKVGA
jgi:hypothetical protein